MVEEKPFNMQENSIRINYTNEGWEKVNIESKLSKLAQLCAEKTIVNYSELKGGFLSKVLLLETLNKKVVVKISPFWNNTGLAREYWCYKQLITKKPSIKIARVFSYTSARNSIFPGHEILILEYIPGHLITHSELERSNMHKKIGSILKKIHEIPMQGYGWLNKTFTGMHQSWIDFLVKIDNLEITRKSQVLSSQDLDWLITNLKRECDINFCPRLLYGDLEKSNIIVNSRSLVFIDFQNCFSGHDLYDVGIGLFFIPQILRNLRHYLRDKITKQNKKQIILYAMRHALSALGHRVTVKDKKGVRKAVRRFHELKKLYQTLCIQNETK